VNAKDSCSVADQTEVGSLTNLQFSGCYMFVSGFLPAPIRMTLNDLECLIQLSAASLTLLLSGLTMHD